MWTTLFFLLLSSSLALSTKTTTTLDCKHHAELSDRLVCDLSLKVNGEIEISGFEGNLSFKTEKFIVIGHKNVGEIFPDGIGGVFEGIESLDVSLSELKEISKKSFEKMENLKELRLEHNEISSIPSDTFDHLTNLQYLNIASNKIQRIPQNLLQKLTKLRKFDASKNQIEKIPQNFFAKNLEIREIFLNGNKIKEIEAIFKVSPVGLETFDLRENGGNCDGKLSLRMANLTEIEEFLEEIFKKCN